MHEGINDGALALAHHLLTRREKNIHIHYFRGRGDKRIFTSTTLEVVYVGMLFHAIAIEYTYIDDIFVHILQTYDYLIYTLCMSVCL